MFMFVFLSKVCKAYIMFLKHNAKSDTLITIL